MLSNLLYLLYWLSPILWKTWRNMSNFFCFYFLHFRGASFFPLRFSSMPPSLFVFYHFIIQPFFYSLNDASLGNSIIFILPPPIRALSITITLYNAYGGGSRVSLLIRRRLFRIILYIPTYFVQVRERRQPPVRRRSPVACGAHVHCSRRAAAVVVVPATVYAQRPPAAANRFNFKSLSSPAAGSSTHSKARRRAAISAAAARRWSLEPARPRWMCSGGSTSTSSGGMTRGKTMTVRVCTFFRHTICAKSRQALRWRRWCCCWCWWWWCLFIFIFVLLLLLLLLKPRNYIQALVFTPGILFKSCFERIW